MDFLHKDSVAGKTLLNLVARGSAIIAELLRLSDHIPNVFEEKGAPGIDVKDREKYDRIMFDFKYLKAPEAYDAKVDADSDLVDLDEEFRETHFALLERFYKLFESIHKYISDFQTYIDEMIDGVFVQHTVESVLMDVEGRQLMVEALYLYGCMLLLLDIRIPGYARERMIVSFYRYRGAMGIDNMDDVVKLCRNNNYYPGGKRPANYPEEFFGRCHKLPQQVILMIIGRLQADDIYNHTSAFPDPQHRSMALSSQAAMLYVLLYFVPDLLYKKEAAMREIADKFFSDNWVVPFYMGFHVDLQDAWAPYKSAMTALNNIVSKNNVTEIVTKQAALLDSLNVDLDKYLTHGILTEEFVLSNIKKLMQTSRACNATLRWLILHRATTNKKWREVVDKAAAVSKLMKLMMNTAHFEAKLKGILKQILDLKQAKWEDCKKESKERMTELSEYFSGEKALTRVKKNTSLQDWFKRVAEQIDGLSFDSPISAGRKIATLIKALEDVQEFHQIESSLQIKQFLGDTKVFLTQMIRTVNVSPKDMADLDTVSDFSYAWELVNDYTPLLHARIKQKPSVVLLLRALFIKLQSILNLPLVRITQAGSKDDVSVADYFSSELVAYVRHVLEIIPQSVFKTLDGIIALQTHRMKPIPTKVERKFLKDFSQLEERYQLAGATHEVSVFTQGILAMETTLMGIIKLDPKQLLEDGIRKELVRQIATALDQAMVFRTGKLDDFENRLQQLGQKLDGFRQSFEYIQDYINVYGLKIWQEEFSRIINYNVEQESNSFLKKKIYDWQSTFQSDAIPIPQFPAVAPAAKDQKISVNFTGRLIREVLSQTDPRKTVYVESMQGWYDLQTNREVVGIRTFSLLHRGVGIFGLTGLDRLLCFMIVRDLTDFARLYRRTVSKPVSQFITKLSAELHPTSVFPPNTDKLYAVAQSKTQKLWTPILEFVTKIGQSQLMRRQIANELNFTCKLDSKLLSCALDVMNQSLVNDVKMHYARPADKPYPGNPLLPDISRYLETAGINSPITKIYMTSEPLDGLPTLMFLFVLAQLQTMTWSKRLATLVCTAKGVPLDGAPLVVGVITLLKQFHSSHTHTFLAYLGQYVRATISSQGGTYSAGSAGSGAAAKAIPPLCVTVLLFLEEFCKFSNLSRKAIDALVPAYIFDRFDH